MVPVNAIDGRVMRTNFSAHAGHYDHYAAVQRCVVAGLCSRLERFEPAGPVLDVGTGTGALAQALGGNREDCPMVIMDLAHDMTLQASRRLGNAGACDGDAKALPFRDRTFRLVASSSVYQWVVELQTAFSEVFRVLQPGGLFAVALFGNRTLYELRNSHRRAVAVCRGIDSSHVQSFPDCNEVLAALQAAGLECLEIDTYPEVEYHADVPTLLRQLKQIGAGNASQGRPRGLASRKIMQKMIAWYEQHYCCSQGLPATYEVIRVIARKNSN